MPLNLNSLGPARAGLARPGSPIRRLIHAQARLRAEPALMRVRAEPARSGAPHTSAEVSEFIVRSPLRSTSGPTPAGSGTARPGSPVVPPGGRPRRAVTAARAVTAGRAVTSARSESRRCICGRTAACPSQRRRLAVTGPGPGVPRVPSEFRREGTQTAWRSFNGAPARLGTPLFHPRTGQSGLAQNRLADTPFHPPPIRSLPRRHAQPAAEQAPRGDPPGYAR